MWLGVDPSDLESMMLVCMFSLHTLGSLRCDKPSKSISDPRAYRDLVTFLCHIKEHCKGRVRSMDYVVEKGYLPYVVWESIKVDMVV